MAQLGLDPEQMKTLSNLMKSKASEIDTIVSTIGGKVTGTWWKGKDADKFRSDWSSTHSKSLKNAASALKEVSQLVDRNRQQQETASA